MNTTPKHRVRLRLNRSCGLYLQSSCTKPELETEGPDVEHVHSLLQPKTNKCLSDNVNTYVLKERQEESRRTRAHDNEAGGNGLYAFLV